MVRVILTCLVLVTAAPLQAAPRDELLRVAPPNAALLLLVQNARDQVRDLLASPFGQWFPTTALGQRLLQSAELKQFRDSATMIARELGTTPQEVLDEILGDAVAFAFSPAPTDRPAEERAVILIRPRKTAILTQLVERLNQVQLKSGELKAVVRRDYTGATYFQRQQAGGTSEFYCFRGEVFAFSSSEADIQAVIDRDNAEAPANVLLERLRQLGVADSPVVLLIQPRPLDAEVKAKLAAATPEEKAFLERFAEVWASLECAAVDLTVNRQLEVGLTVRFQPGKVPAAASKWLLGDRVTRPAEVLIPRHALIGVSAYASAGELIDLVASLAPAEPNKPGVKEWIGQTLGPVIGKDKLPLVLTALGPNWAAWAEPPEPAAFLPTLMAVVELHGSGPERAQAEQALAEAVEYGFRTARVAYNANHTDQIEVKEQKDPRTGAVIVSLVNEKGFPPGFRPSFAVQHGYLVLASTPEAIHRFTVPPPPARPNDYATVARLSGTACRAYLQNHGAQVAKFLAQFGAGAEAELAAQIKTLADVLEWVESADVIVRGNTNQLRIALRVTPTKPLQK
jgi:hypothetical protein